MLWKLVRVERTALARCLYGPAINYSNAPLYLRAQQMHLRYLKLPRALKNEVDRSRAKDEKENDEDGKKLECPSVSLLLLHSLLYIPVVSS